MFFKKTLLAVLTILLSVVLVSPAFSFDGKVSKIEGSSLTLTVDGTMPTWVKKGALAKTSSGLAKVLSVDGQTLVVKVKTSSAKSLKDGDTLDVKPKNAAAGGLLQGC